MNVYFAKRRITAVYNAIGKYFWKKPMIMSIDDTINHIVENHCSVSRFGDGEFEMILGYGNKFQISNSALNARLQQVLTERVDNHIVCLPDIFGDLSYLKESSRKYDRALLAKRRRKYLKLINCRRAYYNAFFTRFYDMFEDKSNAGRWAEKIKDIWKSGGVFSL